MTEFVHIGRFLYVSQQDSTTEDYVSKIAKVHEYLLLKHICSTQWPKDVRLRLPYPAETWHPEF